MTPLEFFQREHIMEMPVDPRRIILNHGFPLYTFAQFSILTGDSINSIIATYGQDGFSLIADGEYAIVYNVQRPEARITWTLMHELAHILLGHLDYCQGRAVARSSHRDRFDYEADTFTAAVLAPLPVLRDCEALTPRKVQALTGLSYTASRYRLMELIHAEQNGDFYSPYYKALSAHFSDYVHFCGKQDAENPAWSLTPPWARKRA